MTFALTHAVLPNGHTGALGGLLARVAAWRRALTAHRAARRDHRDAALMRRLAQELRASDPGMAADLEAAIARQATEGSATP